MTDTQHQHMGPFSTAGTRRIPQRIVKDSDRVASICRDMQKENQISIRQKPIFLGFCQFFQTNVPNPQTPLLCSLMSFPPLLGSGKVIGHLTAHLALQAQGGARSLVQSPELGIEAPPAACARGVLQRARRQSVVVVPQQVSACYEGSVEFEEAWVARGTYLSAMGRRAPP